MFEKLWRFFFGQPKPETLVSDGWHIGTESSFYAPDEEQIERWKQERPTWKQELLIARLAGKLSSKMSKYDASQLIDQLKLEEWRRAGGKMIFIPRIQIV
jgi:hypothetical protein